MALLSLVYRDQLLPRDTYRQTFEALLTRLLEWQACRVMTDLLALAHERGYESEPADKLSTALDAAQLPDMAALRPASRPFPPHCRTSRSASCH